MCRCQGHTHNALADRHPAPNGYCMQCPCTVEPGRGVSRSTDDEAFDRRLERALERAQTGHWFTLPDGGTVGGLAQFLTMVLEQESSPLWSILLTFCEPLTPEQRETIFTAICEATLPLEAATGVEIDVSGQPLSEVRNA